MVYLKTHWYYGHDGEGNVVVSTRRREVPTVDGEVLLPYRCSDMVFYCSKCGAARSAEWGYSEAGCEECERYRALFVNFRKLARELAEGRTALDEKDGEYLMRKIREGKGAALLRILEFFTVPEEIRTRILAKLL